MISCMSQINEVTERCLVISDADIRCLVGYFVTSWMLYTFEYRRLMVILFCILLGRQPEICNMLTRCFLQIELFSFFFIFAVELLLEGILIIHLLTCLLLTLPSHWRSGNSDEKGSHFPSCLSKRKIAFYQSLDTDWLDAYSCSRIVSLFFHQKLQVLYYVLWWLITCCGRKLY